MDKIKRVSLFFRILFQIIFIVLPILLVLGWINAPAAFSPFGGNMVIDMLPPHKYPILHTLDATTRILGFCVSMIPTGLDLLVLYCLIKLFRLYEQGEIFSIRNVNYIRNAGYALLAGQLVYPFYEALISLILTWGNPPHQHLRFIAITIDGTNIGIVLTALLVILVSWIMAEGCKIREEQQLTI